MARGKKAYIETRIARLMDELAELEVVESRFGVDDDYPNQTILVWDMVFPQYGSRVYTFSAVKAAGSWYTTSQYDKIITFDELVRKYLSQAQGVWLVTKLEEI